MAVVLIMSAVSTTVCVISLHYFILQVREWGTESSNSAKQLSNYDIVLGWLQLLNVGRIL